MGGGGQETKRKGYRDADKDMKQRNGRLKQSVGDKTEKKKVYTF